MFVDFVWFWDDRYILLSVLTKVPESFISGKYGALIMFPEGKSSVDAGLTDMKLLAYEVRAISIYLSQHFKLHFLFVVISKNSCSKIVSCRTCISQTVCVGIRWTNFPIGMQKLFYFTFYLANRKTRRRQSFSPLLTRVLSAFSMHASLIWSAKPRY